MGRSCKPRRQGRGRASKCAKVNLANLGDLLLYRLEEFERVRAAKAYIRQLQNEKWHNNYKIHPPHSLLAAYEVRQICTA